MKESSPGGSVGKESACNVGDAGSIPGSGRSPGGGLGNSLQYSCLENLMVRGAWWATVPWVSKSPTWLKRLSNYILHEYNHMNSRKGKTMETEKISGCQGWAGRKEWTDRTDRAQRNFRAMKLLCTILQWWIHVNTHLSKLIECASSRVNTTVNCGLGDNDVPV